MNEFDKFMKDNKRTLQGAFNSVGPLTASEKKHASYEERNGFVHRVADEIQFISPMHKEMHFAKKNKKCMVTACCKYAVTIFNSREYKKKILGPKAIFRPRIKAKVQLMDYAEASKKFWHIYLKDSIAPKEYIIDSENKEAISELIKYFIYDPSCRLDFTKGICLMGGVGTGKTNIMNRISMFLDDNGFDNQFSVKSMRSVIREVSKNGLPVIDSYLMGDICFDDIAIRQTTIKSYGTDINPLDELIQGRYERFAKRNSRPTHFTTNLDFNPNNSTEMQVLRSLYDERSIDRIKEMCNFIYLGGTSRRK